MTSLTTGVGFISMTFVPSPVFSQLGWVAGFGVLAAYALAMTLVPVLLDIFGRPRPWRRGRGGFVQAGLERVLSGAFGLSTTHPWKVIAASGAVIAVAAWGTTQIHFETDFEKRLAPDSRVRADGQYLDEHFVSTNALDLYIETDSKEGILKAELFNDIVALERDIEAHARVDKAVSIVDLLRATHRSFAPEGADFHPLSSQAIAQLFVLLEMQGEESLSRLIDFARSKTRLTIYTPETGVRGQDQLRHEIADMARAKLGGRADVDASSLGSLLGSWVDDIIAGQRRGLGFSLLVIALILVLGFRSLRAGLWSMVPNVLPLLALGGWIGWMWEAADTDTLIIAMIALGIGVDDTIHFIARYQLERKRTDKVSAAIENTFRFSGRGIMITTFIFALGFSPMVISGYLPIHIMGTMLPFCFGVAVVADLLLVPALIRVGAIK